MDLVGESGTRIHVRFVFRTPLDRFLEPHVCACVGILGILDIQGLSTPKTAVLGFHRYSSNRLQHSLDNLHRLEDTVHLAWISTSRLQNSCYHSLAHEACQHREQLHDRLSLLPIGQSIIPLATFPLASPPITTALSNLHPKAYIPLHLLSCLTLQFASNPRPPSPGGSPYKPFHPALKVSLHLISSPSSFLPLLLSALQLGGGVVLLISFLSSGYFTLVYY